MFMYLRHLCTFCLCDK